MKRHISIVTSTRADWGLLSPLADALRRAEGIALSIIATNMHLLDEFGHTVDEIIADGFSVDARVDMYVEGDDDRSRALAAAKCCAGMADAFADIRPDAVVMLGDRYEMLAAAMAAAIMHIPVIHIAGGEISEGAIDDCFRHAITKLASLHLTATEDYRRRVIQMGESPDTVVNTGAIGVWNTFNTPLMTADELKADLGIDFSSPVAVFTYHPATADSSSAPAQQLRAALDALDRFPGLAVVMTAPNNDAGGESLIPILESYARQRPERVVFRRSLGKRRYLSAVSHAALVVGNSSSGIVEVPSAGVPTVDIGERQRGRIAARSVIHCAADADSIAAAIGEALSPKMQALAKARRNPYHKADTLKLMLDRTLAFVNSLPLPPKHFYNLP